MARKPAPRPSVAIPAAPVPSAAIVAPATTGPWVAAPFTTASSSAWYYSSSINWTFATVASSKPMPFSSTASAFTSIFGASSFIVTRLP